MSIPPNTTPSSSATEGLNRRTLVQGAAWTVPAIGIAITAPSASASVVLNIAFDRPNYAIDACGTTTAVVTVTNPGGTPAAGETVLVTLPDGLTSGGAQTVTATTDGAGQITFPITTNNVAQNGIVLTAVTGTASTTATATTTGTVGTATRYIGTGFDQSWTSVPTDAQPVGPSYYLTPDGTLYFGNAIVATGVVSADGFRDEQDRNVVEALFPSGEIIRYLNGTSPEVRASNVMAGSTVIAPAYYLTPDGRLFNANTLLDSNVTSAEGFRDNQNRDVVDYVADGELLRHIGTASQLYGSNVVAGSQVVAPAFYLTPAGDLYHGNTLLASGVTSASGFRDNQNRDVVDALENGQLVRYFDTVASRDVRTNIVPAGSTIFAPDYYLSPGGDLFYGTTQVASGVVNAFSFRDNQDRNVLDTITNVAC